MVVHPLAPAVVTVNKPAGTVALMFCKGAEPVFLNVTDIAAEVEPTLTGPKSRVEVDTVATGAVPVPANKTACCVPKRPMLSSITVKVPLMAPLVLGLNTTLIVQLAPGNKLPVLAGQVPPWVAAP